MKSRVTRCKGSGHFVLIFLAFYGLLLVMACRKERPVLAARNISVHPGVPLRDIVFLNDSVGFVCGGRKNSTGFIYRTMDGGLTWQKVYENNHHCLYTLGFVDSSTGIAGGDSLFMLRSQDTGFNWNFYWLGDSVPPNHFDRPAFRKMVICQSNVFIAGGENFKKGIFYKSTDKGMTWQYKIFANELTGISVNESGRGWICGNGLVGRTVDLAVSWADAGFNGDFFVSVCFPANDTGYIAGYSGSVYRTTDSGNTWNQVRTGGYSPVSTVGINCMVSPCPARIVAGGSGGRLLVSVNGGKEWRTIHTGQDARILAIACHNGEVFMTTDSGTVCRIPEGQVFAD
jgi:photosystem II stability/assembly factor-like uncharacterized protein